MAGLPSQFHAAQHGAQQVNMQSQDHTPAASGRPAESSHLGQLAQAAQLSGLDMAALEGISPQQLATIARLFQSGALQMPPPPPAVSATPSSPAQALLNATRSQSQPTPIDIQEAADMEMEEGEVDDSGEDYAPPQPRDFLRPPPTGPKDRNTSSRESTRNQKQRKPSLPASVEHQRGAVMQSPLQQSNGSVDSTTPSDSKKAQKEVVRTFVMELVAAGYSYQDIAQEVDAPASLTRLFKELSLPLSPVHPNQQPAKPATAPRVAPPKAPPQSRAEYLAKLQAMKNKKTETPTASTTPTAPTEASAGTKPVLATQTPTKAPSLSSAATPDSVGGGASLPNQPASTSKVTVKTELVRQRLAALKASQAAALQKRAGTNAVDTLDARFAAIRQTNPSPSQNGLGAGIADIASAPATQFSPTPAAGLSRPALETQSHSFAGLPGLFISEGVAKDQSSPPHSRPAIPSALTSSPFTKPEVHITSSPAAIGTPTALSGGVRISRKRPVASDFDEAPNQAKKRPFGQSRPGSEDESFVIQTSDDEDDEDDMDVDDAQPSASKPVLQTKSFRDVGPLRDFPPRPTFQTPPSGVSTPGGVTYEQMMKNIEDAKRKIAAKEKKRKASTPKGTVAVALDPTGSESTPPSIPATTNPANGGVDAQASAVDLPTGSVLEGSNALPVPEASVETPLQTHVIDAVDSDSGRDADTLMSGALPHEQAQSVGASQSAEPQRINERAVSEEGELSDDSISNFYDFDEKDRAEGQSNAPVYPAVRATLDSEIGNVSPVSESRSDEPGQDEDAASPLEGDLHSSQPQAIETPEDALSDVSMDESDSDEDSEASDDEDKDVGDDIEEGEVDEDVEEGEVDEDADVDVEEEDEDEEYDPMVYEVESPAPSSTRSAGTPVASGGELADESLAVHADAEHEATSNQADELAPNAKQPAVHLDQAPAKSSRYFTSYESPLQGFRDFRYHPDYLQQVPGGYESLTYSHNIDPETRLCPYETAGGKCNDDACQFQHFQSMMLSGNELLTTMSMRDSPARNAEEQQRWQDGLATLIQQLRDSAGGDEAAVIAAKIADYRREFLADPTKILRLE